MRMIACNSVENKEVAFPDNFCKVLRESFMKCFTNEYCYDSLI